MEIHLCQAGKELGSPVKGGGEKAYKSVCAKQVSWHRPTQQAKLPHPPVSGNTSRGGKWHTNPSVPGRFRGKGLCKKVLKPGKSKGVDDIQIHLCQAGFILKVRAKNRFQARF